MYFPPTTFSSDSGERSGVPLVEVGYGERGAGVGLWARRGTRDEGRGTRGEGRGTRDEGRGTRDEGRGTRDEGRGTEGVWLISGA
ncbi:MAG: hypothetical protein BGO01_03140 [Armatimonadetes bacterium 55-13]|nr:MAG: hypothetical protein BGO01_03140 [Armatimonadetes bacterium 55-13]